MKKNYLIILTLTALIISTKTYATTFKDIDNHWAKKEIEEAINNNLVAGYADNTFKPNKEITLAEYLKILIKTAKINIEQEGNYWPDYFIATAKKEGIIKENEYADYNKKLTRNEIVKITARYINVTDVKKAKIKLKDVENEYKEEIQKLVKLNVITGYDDNTFKGEREVTRAEAIVIAKRAVNAKENLSKEKKYSEEEKIKYSNIKTNENTNGYKIKNQKIYVYDDGKYSNVQEYQIKSENIDTEKVVKTINSLIDEMSYTEVVYVPFEEIVNQLIVRHGENKNLLSLDGADFEITYYENKEYEIKNEKNETEKCYMKIELIKMWKNAEELNSKKYVNEYKKEKLEKCLEIEFGIRHKDNILKYMLEKYKDKISTKTKEIEEKEEKIFGKYKINYQKKENGNPIFYISEIN